MVQKEAGRPKEPGNFPFRNPSFPKESVRTGMKERKNRKNKNRKAAWKRSHRTFLP
jgi:hypothetical protein